MPQLLAKEREVPRASLVRRHIDVFTEAVLDHIIEDVVFALNAVERKSELGWQKYGGPALQYQWEKLESMEARLCEKYQVPVNPALRLVQ